MMPFGIHGDYKRVDETRYPGRVREAALNEEHADDKKRLAELEDFVRTHRKQSRRQQDSLDLHHRKEGGPARKGSLQKPAGKPAPKSGERTPHLDITI
jgi:hypothetical protein